MKKKLGVFLVLLIVACGWMLHLLRSAGHFKTIDPHFVGTCRVVRGVVGAEDITIHPVTGMAYISVCDRRGLAAGKSARGGIYVYDLTDAESVPVRLTAGPGPDFQPHGISLYAGTHGRDALFVINHSQGTHTVEIYDLTAGGLDHRRTVTGPALVSPNDIAGAGHDRFYVTNDHRYTGGPLQIFEEYLKLPLANIVYYDGRSFNEAAGGIGYANGISISPDGRILYTAGTTQRTLQVYDRNPVSGELAFKKKIHFDTGLDNIEIGPDGALWIGAHPQLLKFVAHSKDAANRSPSQILRVVLPAGGTPEIEEIYLDDGEKFSGSSVGAVYGDRLLIGSVFEEKILDCRLDR